MSRSQTLRQMILSFIDPEGQKSRADDLPEILDQAPGFRKKTFESLPRERYIGWHGDYHVEYGHPRRMPIDWGVAAIKVRRRKPGNYLLRLEIAVSEAPMPYVKDFQIHCV